MAEGFEVRTDALRAYADGADVRAATLTDLAEQVEAAQVPRGAFGWLPGIGGRVHDAYAGLLHDALDGLRTAAELTTHVADGVRVTAGNYDVADTANDGSARALDAALPGAGG